MTGTRLSERRPDYVTDRPEGPIILPLPPDELRANRRSGLHWGGVNKFKMAYMDACLVALREQGWRGLLDGFPMPRAVHVTLMVYLGKRQRCDSSDVGYWAKASLDACVQVGVFVDDSSAWINPFTVGVKRDMINPRLEISWKERYE